MIQAIIRTEDDEQRKQLPIPWEWVIWNRCKRRGTLPRDGGELNQPHILMACFDIIDGEIARWEKELEQKAKEEAEEKRRMAEINQRLANPHLKPPALPPNMR